MTPIQALFSYCYVLLIIFLGIRMRFFLWATQKQALGNRHQREVGSNGSWLRHCLRDQGTRKQQSSAMWTTIQFGYFYQSIILLFVQAALVYSFLNDTNSSAWVLLPCSFNYIYMHKFFLSVLSSEALHMRALEVHISAR